MGRRLENAYKIWGNFLAVEISTQLLDKLCWMTASQTTVQSNLKLLKRQSLIVGRLGSFFKTEGGHSICRFIPCIVGYPTNNSI